MCEIAASWKKKDLPKSNFSDASVFKLVLRQTAVQEPNEMQCKISKSLILYQVIWASKQDEKFDQWLSLTVTI